MVLLNDAWLVAVGLVLMVYVLVLDELIGMRLIYGGIIGYWCVCENGSDNHAKSRILMVGSRSDQVSFEDMVSVVMVFLGDELYAIQFRY